MATAGTLVGATLAGRYRLNKLIGQGGMGSVYEAFDRQMSDRVVAVKVLAPHLVADTTQVTRFEQEARAANQLRHPNTISVLDFGHTTDGHVFMALEYLHGETLTQVLRFGRLEPTRALYMIRQVCKSLAEAHAKGIIHRDLKPDNIFVCEIYGEKDFIKVIDFGIAKLAVGGAELTQVGKMFGTPRYLSPEQAQGLPLSAPSDLYSVGVILFEMLTGQAPFQADDSLSVAIKHVQERPPTLKDVAPTLEIPQLLERLVAKLLEKKPQNRFQNAEEVLVALDECLQALGQFPQQSGHFTPVSTRTPARPSTIPPPQPLSARTPSAVKNLPTKASPDDATRTLVASGEELNDSTQMLDHVLAPTDHEEATRAVDAANLEAPEPNDAGDERPGGQGHTLALDVEVSADGGLKPAENQRRTRVDTQRPRENTHPSRKRATSTGVRAAPEPEGPSKWALLAVAVVLGLLGGGTAWYMTRPKTLPQPVVVNQAPEPQQVAEVPVETPKPQPEPKLDVKPLAEAPKPQPVEVETTVDIVSTPPLAQVTIDGMPAGPTPVTLHLKADAQKLLTAVVKLDGYEDVTLPIDPQKVREAGLTKLPVMLKAKPKVVAKPVVRKPKQVDWQ